MECIRCRNAPVSQIFLYCDACLDSWRLENQKILAEDPLRPIRNPIAEIDLTTFSSLAEKWDNVSSITSVDARNRRWGSYVPALPGVYCFESAEGIEYVGASQNMKRRMRTHPIRMKLKQTLQTVYFSVCDSWDTAMDLEAYILGKHKAPRLNIVRSRYRKKLETSTANI